MKHFGLIAAAATLFVSVGAMAQDVTASPGWITATVKAVQDLESRTPGE